MNSGVVYVSGDNSSGQLWCTDDITVTPTFIEANNFPFKQISHISHISAYDQSIALALSVTEIAFRNSEGKV